MSNSRKVAYFFNVDTMKSTWERPEGMTEEEANALPGAKEYLNADGAHAGQVRASHLLVKHKDSRRASSWKEVIRSGNLCNAITEKSNNLA